MLAPPHSLHLLLAHVARTCPVFSCSLLITGSFVRTGSFVLTSLCAGLFVV